MFSGFATHCDPRTGNYEYFLEQFSHGLITLFSSASIYVRNYQSERRAIKTWSDNQITLTTSCLRGISKVFASTTQLATGSNESKAYN